MANILELMGLVTPQAEAETVPALKKALGFNMMDEVQKPDPVAKKLDKKLGNEGTLVTQNRIQTALAKPRVVSQAANEQAVQNVTDVKSDLGLGNQDSTSEIDTIVKSLKDRLAKVGETSQAAKDNQLNYQIGALVTKNPVLQQLAGRSVASADDQTTGLQAKLLEALKAKAGIKKDEDTKATELYKNQLLDKYYKSQGIPGEVNPRLVAVGRTAGNSIDNDKQFTNFDLADQGIAKAQNLLKKSENDPKFVFTPELFADAEADFVQALNQARRSSTGNEREKQSLNNFETKLSKFKQLVTSKPDNVDIPEHKANISMAMQDLVHSLDSARQIRAKTLRTGSEYYPDMVKNIINSKIEERLQSRYSDPNYVYGQKNKSGGLSDAEKKEMEALKKEFGG